MLGNCAHALQPPLQADTMYRRLEEVRVNHATPAHRARQQTINTQVVGVGTEAYRPVSVIDLLNATSGIRIRQAGGLGSENRISINGYQSNGIRVFKDEIPIDHYGPLYNLSTISIHTLAFIEVYKGALPPKLAGDALGGALNLVSASPQNQGYAAYEVGSFNTHRANLGLHARTPLPSLSVGLDYAFTYTDNDYPVTVNTIDEKTSTLAPMRIHLFHNAFGSHFIQAYAQWQGQHGRGSIRLGMDYVAMRREEQHGIMMSMPYGAVLSRAATAVPSLRIKRNWLAGRLRFDQFVAYNRIDYRRTDTLSGRYDWYGRFTPIGHVRGEASANGSLSDIDFTHAVSRTHVSYALDTLRHIELNGTYSRFVREGTDPRGATYPFSGRDILSVPANYGKFTGLLAYRAHQRAGRMDYLLSVKFLAFHTRGTDVYSTSLTEAQTTANGQHLGALAGIRHDLSRNHEIRLSGEYAYRLPDQGELLGDGGFRLSNFSLRPEKSTNITFSVRDKRTGHWRWEVNTFYRITRDLILQIPITPPYAQHQNVEQVRGVGVEGSVRWQPFRLFQVYAYASWQDFRLYHVEQVGLRDKDGARLRNVPWLQGGLTGILRLNDRFHLDASYQFVNTFYLEYIPRHLEPRGFATLYRTARVAEHLIIPQQHQVSVGASYGFPNGLTLSALCSNLADSKQFDFYRVQRPGRAVSLKITYPLSLHLTNKT